jgi:pyruvate dehydrogenase E1 component
MPKGVEDGIIRGMYQLHTAEAGRGSNWVQLLGSGAILRSVLQAQKILAEKFNISSTTWSVTSYAQVAREALLVERYNRLHPLGKQRMSYLDQIIEGHEGPFVAASDYVRAVPRLISQYINGGVYALGTDGFGRSETREELRRHFEVDAESIVIAALYRLSLQGKVTPKQVDEAITMLDYDRDKIDPLTA